MSQVFDLCRRLFDCHFPCSSDFHCDDISTNDRSPDTKSYALWVRDVVEADKNLAILSARDLTRRQVSGITFLERLLLEVTYFTETQQHLDVDVTATLCTGSRYPDGFVPTVRWDRTRLTTFWCHSDQAMPHVRAREVLV